MLDQLESQLPAHRERLLPPMETLAMFLAQALVSDRSCQQAANGFVARRVAGGLSACSTSTGAFCRARQRLPESMVSSQLRFTGRRLVSITTTEDRWQGRRVRLVDGTAVPMPDTAANQAAFTQLGRQTPGLGFPSCRLLALLCLSSGAIIDAVTCPVKGKGTDEQSPFSFRYIMSDVFRLSRHWPCSSPKPRAQTARDTGPRDTSRAT